MMSNFLKLDPSYATFKLYVFSGIKVARKKSVILLIIMESRTIDDIFELKPLYYNYCQRSYGVFIETQHAMIRELLHQFFPDRQIFPESGLWI